MPEEVTFPSKNWFEQLAAFMNADESSFRRLGPIDCSMVVKVDRDGETELFEVVFEAFSVRAIRRLERVEDAAPDHFVIEATLDTWSEMVDNIRAHGAADLSHTLNYLTFPDDPMTISGPDQLQIDAFYRYNQSLQHFFNGAAQLETRDSQ
jgi:hypothetical protein